MPVVTFQQSPARDGWVKPKYISPTVWPRRISPVMLITFCGRTKTTDMTDFVFAMEYLFLDWWFRFLHLHIIQ
jgi:hypothetical protein